VVGGLICSAGHVVNIAELVLPRLTGHLATWPEYECRALHRGEAWRPAESSGSAHGAFRRCRKGRPFALDRGYKRAEEATAGGKRMHASNKEFRAEGKGKRGAGPAPITTAVSAPTVLTGGGW
jgi:hypothetical protein